jgi:hypothetical protein
MATSKKKVEYGLVVAPIGTTNSDKSMTKATFFETVEAQYPSADGWEVYSITCDAGSSETVFLAYHMRKVNS